MAGTKSISSLRVLCNLLTRPEDARYPQGAQAQAPGRLWRCESISAPPVSKGIAVRSGESMASILMLGRSAMGYRPHPAPQYMLFGYDPVRDLPADHLARLVEYVVEEANLPKTISGGRGQPAFDPRLCAKVLVYGYATRVRSSRQLERLCSESLPYLFLTRGDTPSYRTLCHFRVNHSDIIERVFTELFAVAGECGMERLGAIVIDSSKFRDRKS